MSLRAREATDNQQWGGIGHRAPFFAGHLDRPGPNQQSSATLPGTLGPQAAVLKSNIFHEIILVKSTYSNPRGIKGLR